MNELRVQRGSSASGERVDQLLMRRARPLVVVSVLLDRVQRHGAVLPGGCQAGLADVRRVGERIREHDELVHFHGGVHLDPVLRSTPGVLRLSPRALSTGVAGGVRRDDSATLRQLVYETLEEAFQYAPIAYCERHKYGDEYRAEMRI